MQSQLSGGIPSESDYKSILESDEFKDLERFSNHFLSVNNAYLKEYKRKWVQDSLHHWSRQWEYPFALSRIHSILERDGRKRILDAGSGVTFFPYYIKSKYDSADVYCIDYDKTLGKIFGLINSRNKHQVEFSSFDLRETRYEDAYFDIVYSISVLEHTDNYEEIMEEFYRITKPGGKVIITFDISLDGTRDISPERGTELLRALTTKFENEENLSPELHRYISLPGILTTIGAKDIDSTLLPWRYPSFVYRTKALITGKAFGRWPPPLTVFCLSLKRSKSR